MPSTPTPPASDNDALFDSYIDSDAYLDHSFCSNFSCCGQTLPDLHHLIDHFEEEHVLPVPPDADNRPIYSSPVYARPAGPHASYILSYPQPDPPLQQVSLPFSSAHGPLRPVPDLHHLPDLVYSPPSAPSPSALSSCYPSPSLGEPLCLPPALFTFQPPRPCTPPPTTPHRSRIAGNPLSENDLQSNRTPDIARSGIGPQRTAKQRPRTDPLARTRPPPHTPERPPVPHSGSGPRRRDGREKMYKCPSYLNPNGLKYHLEKGTCTNAETRRRAPLPPSVAAAALAPSASVPALSSVAPSPASVVSSPTMTDDEGGDEDGEDAVVART
ncbi:hypothetical protein BD413DRAFT_476260 [Trametes elegans]|nr:hypothetical protein BD413DRAFT_476260 [Trametes elegans]